MTTQESVVTPQRYAQGRTWDDYLRYIASPENLARPSGGGGQRDDNSDRFRKNYDDFHVTAEEEQTLKALPKRRVLVIGEDWCPDVYRGLPTVAKLCQAAGWELRMFQRDDNKDIMAEFLNQHGGNEYESIPAVVLYTPENRYVGHWIERPALANRDMDDLRRRFTREPGESEDDMRARLRQAYRALQQSDQWDAWKHATVDEIVAIAKNEPA